MHQQARRKPITLLAGDHDDADVGENPICYCWNPLNDGVPKYDCVHQMP